MPVNFGMSFNSFATISAPTPAGSVVENTAANLPQAVSVGANTVKGPSPLKVSTKPAFLTAVSNIL